MIRSAKIMLGVTSGAVYVSYQMLNLICLASLLGWW